MNTEYAVLGWVLLFSPNAMAEALTMGCQEGWFTDAKARKVWQVVENRHTERVGVATYLVAGDLAKDGKMQDVNLNDLAEMQNAACPTSMSFGDALRQLKRDFGARVRAGLWSAGRSAGTEGNTEREIEAVQGISQTFAAETAPETLQSAAAALGASLDGGEVPDLGLATGLIDLDRTLGTLQPGELIVVAARPGCGKSSLLRQVGALTAVDGRRVVLVSTEMGAGEIVVGAAKQLSGVPWSKTSRLPKPQLDEFKASVRRISSMANLRLIEARSLTVLIAKWRAMMSEEYPPQLFIVDYLQQLDANMRKGETLAAAVGRISSELKVFAKENKVVVLAAAQLNRESAKDGDPQLYHLRDSGAIEQDADRVMMLKVDVNTPADARMCPVICFQRKNRNGPLGECTLNFDRWTTRFHNYTAA